MAKFSNLRFPSQMRPELARHVAENLCWSPPASPVVSFMALAVLYASWSAQGVQSMEQLAAFVSKKFIDFGPDLLNGMADNKLYQNLQSLPHAGPLTTVQAAQAAQLWANALKDSDLKEVFDFFQNTLDAAFKDDTERGEAIATNLAMIIEAMTPTPAIDPEKTGPIMLMTPMGPVGPFPNLAEANKYMKTQGFPPIMLPNGLNKPGAAAPASLDEAQSMPRPATPDAQPQQSPHSPQDNSKGLVIYNQGTAISTVQRMPPPAMGEGNAEQRRLLQTMANESGFRPYAQVPEGEPLAELYQSFPHFQKPLDFIARRLALAGCGEEGTPVRFPPILLRGAPGTGKTFFAQELARVLGTTYVERDLSTVSEAFVLSGHDSGWKGSKPGVVFDTLVNGKTANPIIVLNELDKCFAKGNRNSPMDSLHALLEPVSANAFKDEFVPVQLDTSRVNWVMTANDGEIPEQIQERLDIFDIPKPTLEQCRAIAISVWKSICSRDLPKGHGFADELGEPLLATISVLSPRSMRKALTDAASSAVLSDRKYLTLEDLNASQVRYAPAKTQSMGFLNS